MLLPTCLAIIAIALMPSAYLTGQLSAARTMTRYYGKPQPDWCEAIGLLRAARRDDHADAES